MTKYLFLIALLPFMVIGEDLVTKAMADHAAAVSKAKDVFEKAEYAAKTKLVLDLKAIMKRSTPEKVAAALEILNIDNQDQEAYDLLNKEGKLAELGKEAASVIEQYQNKAVYKVWNDKGRLDYAGTGLIDTLQGGDKNGNENLQYKFGTIKAMVEITTAGEYKVQAANYEGTVVVTFAGKRVDWSKPTVLPLAKGKYPLVIELNRPRSFSLKFALKTDATMEAMSAPYLATDNAAVKEAKTDKMFKEPKK